MLHADLQGQGQGVKGREVDEGLPGDALRLLQMAPRMLLMLTKMDLLLLRVHMTSLQQLVRVKVIRDLHSHLLVIGAE